MGRKVFCILLALTLFMYISGCKASTPRLMPTYEDREIYVWLSEDPKAYITQSFGVFGGQMEINGDMHTICVVFDFGSYDFVVFDEAYSFDPKTHQYQRFPERSQCVFSGSTTYRSDSITCKARKRSENFGGQKIVFTKYVKDEVAPADFGFDIEQWDDFVTVIDSSKTDEHNSFPEETPASTPIPEPTPAPTALPEQGPVYPSAAKVIPSRRRFLPRS